METLEFTQEELGSFGRDNAEGAWLATVSYFVSKGSGLEEWIDYVGNLFAGGWSNLKGKSVKEIARIALLNWASCGAKVVSFSGDDSKAEAVLEAPAEDPATFWHITYADVQKINQVFVPISKVVELDFFLEG